MLKGKNVASIEKVDAEAKSTEEVNFVGGNQWPNQRMNQGGYQQNNQYQRQGQGSGLNSGFNKTPQSALSPDVVQDMFQQLLDANAKLTGEFNSKLDKQYIDLKSEIEQVKIHLKKLDIQVAQTAEGMRRQAGFLPGKTDTNPREHCNAVTTRGAEQRGENSKNNSGDQDLAEEDEEVDEEIECEKLPVSIDRDSSVDRHSAKSADPPAPVDQSVDRHESCRREHIIDRHTRPVSIDLQQPVSTDTLPSVDRHTRIPKIDHPFKRPGDIPPKVSGYKPSLPYPKAPIRSKKEVEEARCKEIMKELEVRIPFFEACNLAPSLKKYVKKMVNNSMGLDEGVMMITETCSSIIQKRMPKKLKDPGAFLLSCTIGNLTFGKSLCDLGSSVNLMPLSVAKRLGYNAFYYTSLTLVLADKSTRKPEGLLEDVPIKIGNCWIPADFVILDYGDNEPKDPIILGRSFLATAGALIDCRDSTITLRVDDSTMKFDMSKMHGRPTIEGQTFVVEGLNEVVELGKGGQGVEQSKAVTEKPPPAPVTAVKQKAPDITRHSPKPRYMHSKPTPFSHAGKRSLPPRHARPVIAVIPTYLGRPHDQNAYSPPWMKRLSKGPRPP